MKTTARFLLLLLLAVSQGSLDLCAESHQPDANGYIHHWLMLAPIPLETDETGAEAIEFNILRREASLQPSVGQTEVIAGYQRQWQQVQSEGDIFDFNVELKAPHDNAIGYLVAYLRAPKTQQVNLLAGGNDQTRVFFNGEVVSTASGARALTKDSDIASDLTLKQGLNVVVLKVINEVGNWQACLRLTNTDGQPLTNYQISLTP